MAGSQYTSILITLSTKLIVSIPLFSLPPFVLKYSSKAFSHRPALPANFFASNDLYFLISNAVYLKPFDLSRSGNLSLYSTILFPTILVHALPSS